MDHNYSVDSRPQDVVSLAMLGTDAEMFVDNEEEIECVADAFDEVDDIQTTDTEAPGPDKTVAKGARRIVRDETTLDPDFVLVHKRPKDSSNGNKKCIIHFRRNKHDWRIRPLTEDAFETIQSVVEFRSSLSTAAHRLDDICWKVPKTYDADHQGFHRSCYTRFTNIGKFRPAKKRPTDTGPSSSPGDQAPMKSGSSATTSACSEALLPSDRCIFCGKGLRRHNRISERLSKCRTEHAEIFIQQAAEVKNDCRLMKMIPNWNLRERKAHFHESCRRDYIRRDDRNHHRPSLRDPDEDPNRWAEKRAAYSNAFKFVCDYIDENVIVGKMVARMKKIRELFLKYLQEHTPVFYNENYPTDCLRERIVRHYGDQVEFFMPNTHTTLLYSPEGRGRIGDALGVAFEAATSDSRLLEEAAMILHRHIIHGHQTSKEIPWLPSAALLNSSVVSPPSCLTEFISQVITGKSGFDLNTQNSQVSLSIAEDVCAATIQDFEAQTLGYEMPCTDDGINDMALLEPQ